LQEIALEARQRKADGEMTDNLEDELAALFTGLAPIGTKRWFFEAARVHFDSATRGYQGILSGLRDLAGAIGSPVQPAAEPPRATVASRTVDRLFKVVAAARVDARVEHLAKEVAAFASTSVRTLEVIEQRLGYVDEALRLLGERIEEDNDGGRSLNSLARHLEHRLPPEDLEACSGTVVETFSNAGGKVLHGDCADGRIVSSMMAAGVDAYGVDPRVEAAYSAMRRGAPVRIGAVLDHLASLGDAALGGLFLSGSIDRGSSACQLRLLELSSQALCGGATLALAVTEPSRLPEEHRDGAFAELLDWSPKTPGTWEEMIAYAGFVDVRVLALPASGGSTRSNTAEMAPVAEMAPAAGMAPATRVRPSHLLLAVRSRVA
jgi:hypothetical protein